MSVLPVGIAASGDQAYTIEDSLRFRHSATAYLDWTPASAGNQSTWTFSCWWKFGRLGLTFPRLLSTGTNSSNRSELIFITSTNQLRYYSNIGGTISGIVDTAAVLRDPSAWYHIVVKFDTTESVAADRLKIYINGVNQTLTTTTAVASGNHYINNARLTTIGKYFGSTTNYIDGYLTEVNFIDGQALTADDFGEFDGATGVWKPKRYTGTYGTNGFYLPMTATTQADGFNTVLYTGNGSTQSITGVGFSPDLVWIKKRSGAENHGLFDTVRGAGNFLVSNDTASEYARGNSVTSYDADGFSLGNYSNTNVSGGTNVAWCWDAGDNQPTTGISSVLYTGTAAALKVAGFGFSPDLVWLKSRTAAYSNALFDSVRGTSKWLTSNGTNAEATVSGVTSFDSDGFTLGSDTGQNNSGTQYVAWGWDAGDGDPVTNTQGTINSTVKANDATGFSIVTWTGSGVADDRVGHGLNSAPEVIIYKNRNGTGRWYVWTTAIDGSDDYLLLDGTNVANNIPATYTSPTSTTISNYGYGSSTTMVAYCFKSVSGMVDIGTYTGTGTTSGPTITTGFRPGFVLVKSTTNGALSWHVYDGTRNPFNAVDLRLNPNSSAAEDAVVTLGNFTDTGFEITSSATQVNQLNGTYIYMAFKGSYSDYVSPLNTNGSVDSRVKANPDKGFSIATYTVPSVGSTSFSFGHGLSTAPSFVISKARSAATGWITYHSSVGTGKYLTLNTTNAEATEANSYSAVSSTTVTGGSDSWWGVGQDYVSYCFAEVTGYSKFGSYTGNPSSGVTVTTGFRPAWVMMKSSSNASTPWQIFDNTREPNNPRNQSLIANGSTAEPYDTNSPVVFTDTGFELTGGASSWNNYNTGTWIYMAFAETRDAQFNFDASGNKNNWTPNNINSNASSESTYDLMNDVPTLTDENNANFCTWNPLDSKGSITPVDGNLKATIDHTEDLGGTFSVAAGKYYWEVELDSFSSVNAAAFGIMDTTHPNPLNTSAAWRYYRYDGTYWNGSSHSVSGLATYTTGDIVGIALDLDSATQTVAFYKNGTLQTTQNLTSGLNWTPFARQSTGTTSNIVAILNAGQRPFAYTPPTGFLPLNTYNLPDATIEDGSEQFNTVLYTGNGSTNSITGVNFQPDLVWMKSRSSGTDNHYLANVLSGTQKALFSNLTNAEATDANGLQSFDSDGFTIGTQAQINTNTVAHVAWNWKANGSGVSNTDGSITSTVSANTTSGFSIVGFTAPSGTGNFSAGHGLGVTPSMVIVKTRDSSSAPWYTWHNTFSNLTDDYMRLNATTAKQTQSSGWGAGMTSSVIGLRAGYTTVPTEDHIAYVFAGVEGFSKFGSYTGNGSTDGPFIYTGFSPAWLLIKRSDAAANWLLYDNKRLGYNTNGYYLLPDLTNAEGSGTDNRFDLNSNGFKVRDSNQSLNVSGGTYIYAAFAENPFKNALAR